MTLEEYAIICKELDQELDRHTYEKHISGEIPDSIIKIKFGLVKALKQYGYQLKLTKQLSNELCGITKTNKPFWITINSPQTTWIPQNHIELITCQNNRYNIIEINEQLIYKIIKTIQEE